MSSVCHAQRAGASELDAPFLNEGDDGVLDDFGIHFEGRDAGVASQGAEHGVGDVSHARLQGEEGGGDDAPLHVGCKEVGYVLSDFIRHRVGCAESACLVGDVHFYHADYLFRVDLYVGQSDAVAGTDDRDGAAVGRTFHFVEVVHADDAFAVRRVQLDDDAVCQAGNGGRKSYACREVDASVVGQFAGFHDSGGDVSQESGAQTLRHLREVDVGVIDFAVVHRLAEIGVGGVGGAELNGVCTGQRSVARVSCRSSGNDSDAELFAPRVFFFGLFRQFGSYCFGASCRRKSAQRDDFAVLYQAGGFCRCHSVVVHSFQVLLIYVLVFPFEYLRVDKCLPRFVPRVEADFSFFRRMRRFRRNAGCRLLPLHLLSISDRLFAWAGLFFLGGFGRAAFSAFGFCVITL